MSTCGCHEAPAWFISFVCHRSPLGICPCRETESYLLTHSTNVYEYLQCCNYCARHRLKDKLKAIPVVLRATTRTLQHEGGRRRELLENREKAVQGTRGVTSGKRKGGQVERKTVGFLEETAPELVFKERGRQQDRRVHSLWRVEWCFLPSLNKLLALQGQPHLPSLLIIQGTSHTGALRKPSGSPPPPAVSTGELHVTASMTCTVCQAVPTWWTRNAPGACLPFTCASVGFIKLPSKNGSQKVQ